MTKIELKKLVARDKNDLLIVAFATIQNVITKSFRDKVCLAPLHFRLKRKAQLCHSGYGRTLARESYESGEGRNILT